MLDKIKTFARDHAEEIVAGSIMLAVGLTIATTGAAIGYKMAEHDLEMVGMTTYHGDDDKIAKVKFRQRNGKTVSYIKPRQVN